MSMVHYIFNATNITDIEAMLIFSFFFRHVPTHMYLRTRNDYEGNHEKYGGLERILDDVL